MLITFLQKDSNKGAAHMQNFYNSGN